MRAINRDFSKVLFHRIETLPLKTIYGDMPITWNTEKQAIAAKITTPLPAVFLADLYETVPLMDVRRAIEQDMRDIPWNEDDWIR